MAKTFRVKTVLNSDDVNISKDNRYIQIHNVWSEPVRNKKGHVINHKTNHKVRKYPNTLKNRKKAESLLGPLRKSDY